MSGMLLKESDKVRNVFVTQVIGYLIYLIGCCKKVSFGFKDNIFINKF